MTYSKQTRQQAMRRLAKDSVKIKYDDMISLVEKGNPGDVKSIRRLKREQEKHFSDNYPELFEGKKW